MSSNNSGRNIVGFRADELETAKSAVGLEAALTAHFQRTRELLAPLYELVSGLQVTDDRTFAQAVSLKNAWCRGWAQICESSKTEAARFSSAASSIERNVEQMSKLFELGSCELEDKISNYRGSIK
jgi:hypothetical protein